MTNATPKPLSEEERAELEELAKEWPARVVANLTQEQRDEFLRLLSPPKRSRGRPWDKVGYIILITEYWSLREGGMKAAEAWEHLADRYEVQQEHIKASLAEARKRLSPSDVSEWARPAL